MLKSTITAKGATPFHFGRVSLLIVAGFAISLQPAARAQTGSQTFYVATNGSDSNVGSLTAPFLTLKKGVAGLRPGGTLYVRAGTYTESLEDAIPGGSSWSAPVTVAAYPGETPVIKPPSGANRVFTFSLSTSAYIVIDGFVLDAGLVTYDAVKLDYKYDGQFAHHIRIKNCEIKNAPMQGISVSGNTGQASYSEFLNLKVHDNGSNDFQHGIYVQTAYNRIDRCQFYRNSGWGIQIYHNPESGANNNIISNNQCFNNARTGGRGAGIVIAAGSGNLAFNNIVWGNNGGIQVDYGAVATALYNNTVYANGAYGLNIGPGSTNADIRNNIVYLHTTPIVNLGPGTTLVANLLTNPNFVNATGLNFHLATNSPAIDAGVTIPQVTVDFDGVSRPQGRAYDIGAYETAAISTAPSGGSTPVAYWKFNEGTGTSAMDSSGNGLTASLTNVAWAADKNGNAGKAILLNGVNAFGNVGESSVLSTPNTLTVAFWVRCQSGGSQDPRILSKRYSWDLKLNGSSRYFQFSSGAGYAVSQVGCPLNTWEHFAVTYNNGTVKMYVNGVQQPLLANTFTAGMTIAPQSYGMSIGVDADGQRFFNGLLNNVRIYNVEVSATDIQSLYSSGT